MITEDSVPRLSPAARLRFDRVAGRTLLLYPERGMVLSDTAAAIVAMCTGERRVRELVEHLQRVHGGARETIERDVLSFLRELERRRLLVVLAAREAP